MIKSYDMVQTGRGFDIWHEMKESVHDDGTPDGQGDWVRREDAEAELASTQRELASTQRELAIKLEVDSMAMHRLRLLQEADARVAALEAALRGIVPHLPTSTAKEGGAMMYSAHVRAADAIRDVLAIQSSPAATSETGAAHE